MRIIQALKMGCVMVAFVIAVYTTAGYDQGVITLVEYMKGMATAIVFLFAGYERRKEKRWKQEN